MAKCPICGVLYFPSWKHECTPEVKALLATPAPETQEKVIKPWMDEAGRQIREWFGDSIAENSPSAGDIATLISACAPQSATPAPPSATTHGETETGLQGQWRHADGMLFCGTLRIAKQDFDTDPSLEFQTEVFDDICRAMNTRLGEKEALEPATPEGQMKCFTVVPSSDSSYDSETIRAGRSWRRALRMVEDSLEHQFNEDKPWDEIKVTLSCRTLTQQQFDELETGE